MNKNTTKTCKYCKYWKQIGRDKNKRLLGECEDAIERARKVVPFAINLSVSNVYSFGGSTCPCFIEKE